MILIKKMSKMKLFKSIAVLCIFLPSFSYSALPQQDDKSAQSPTKQKKKAQHPKRTTRGSELLPPTLVIEPYYQQTFDSRRVAQLLFTSQKVKEGKL